MFQDSETYLHFTLYWIRISELQMEKIKPENPFQTWNQGMKPRQLLAVKVFFFQKNVRKIT